MKFYEMLGSPKGFDVFYKFIMKWEKDQSWRKGYSVMVEFLELVLCVYPSWGKCARRSFLPTFALTRSQQIAFLISRLDALPPLHQVNGDDLRHRYRYGNLTEDSLQLFYIRLVDELLATAWSDFVNRAEGQSIQAELPVETPPDNRRLSAEPVVASSASASSASAVAGVAIAPGSYQDKPGAGSVSRENAEFLLRRRTEEQLQGIAAVRQQPSAAAIAAVRNLPVAQIAPSAAAIAAVRSLPVAQIGPSASAIAAVRNLPVAPIGQPTARIAHHRRSPALDATRRPDPSAAPVNGQQSEVQDVFRKRGKCVPASVAAAPSNAAAARKLIAHIQVQPRNARINIS